MSKPIVIDPQQPGAAERAVFTEISAQLCGSLERIPEALRPVFQSIKDKADAVLKLPLPEADGKPGVAAAALSNALVTAGELLRETLAKLEKLTTDHATDRAQLCGLQEQLTKKDLISKADHEAALQAERETVLKTERTRAQLCSAHRLALSEAQLTVFPSDDALAVEEKDFTPLKERAVARRTRLAGLGDLTKLKPMVLTRALYGSEDDLEMVAGSMEAALGEGHAFAGGGAPGGEKAHKVFI